MSETIDAQRVFERCGEALQQRDDRLAELVRMRTRAIRVLEDVADRNRDVEIALSILRSTKPTETVWGERSDNVMK